MAKICEHCGNKNNSFVGDPFILSDEKILCYKCAEKIKNLTEKLYRVKNKEQLLEVRGGIVFEAKMSFSDDIAELIIKKIDSICDQISSNLKIDDWNNKSSAKNNEHIVVKSESSVNNDEDNESILFSNIGSKIKNLASVIAWIGIILSVILGIVTFETSAGLGFLIMIFGGLVSWIGSFILYGFGQLIENTDEIRKSLKNK